jgi:hypothetical protein
VTNLDILTMVELGRRDCFFLLKCLYLKRRDRCLSIEISCKIESGRRFIWKKGRHRRRGKINWVEVFDHTMERVLCLGQVRARRRGDRGRYITSRGLETTTVAVTIGVRGAVGLRGSHDSAATADEANCAVVATAVAAVCSVDAEDDADAEVMTAEEVRFTGAAVI